MMNRSRIAVGVAGVAAVALMAWQGWNTHRLQQQIVQLQQQVAANSQAANQSPQVLTAPTSPSTPLSTSPLPAPLLAPATPQQAAPGNDPFQLSQDPFADMQKMQQQLHQHMQQLMSGMGFDKDFDSLFDMEPFRKGGMGFGSSMGFGADPSIDFKENTNTYEIGIAIPSGSNVEVTTSVQGRDLTIEGKVTSEQQSQNKGSSLRSHQTRQFARTFTLPPDADTLGITTNNSNGKVVVTVPRTGKGSGTLSQQLPQRRGVSL